MEEAGDERARAGRRQLVHGTGEEDHDLAIDVDVRRRAECRVLHSSDERIISNRHPLVVGIGEASSGVPCVGDDDRTRARCCDAAGADNG